MTINEPLRFFVAGPYCAYNCEPHHAVQVTQKNVDLAIMTANLLIDRGHYAFVPHLSHYLHIHMSCSKDRGAWYYEFDNTFLDLWANAIFLINPSPGADKEVQRALERGYLYFHRMQEVPWVVKTP